MKRVSILCVLFACLASLLSACGGGGGENSSPAQLNLSIDLTSLPAAIVNMPYNQTVSMTASGGTSPCLYSCTVSNCVGLSTSVSPADPTTGGALCLISGTPLNTGAFTINFSVSDSMKVSSSAGPLSINISTSAEPLDNWHLRNPSSQGNTLNGVTFGNGTFATVGDSGTILTSSDGVTWTSRTSGTEVSLFGVTYGNGTFVAVGDSGTILTSSDGVTWTARNSGTSVSFTGVTYGNGTFVAVGGIVLTSPDGATWSLKYSGPRIFSGGVTYANGIFALVKIELGPQHSGFSSIVITPDLVTWSSPEHVSVASVLRSVTYGNGVFVTVGNTGLIPANDGVILSSPDGLTWTLANSGIVASLNGVTYGDGSFVAVGYSGSILTSPNGETWTSRISGITGSALRSVTYGNGTFVAVGDNGTVLQSDSVH